MSAPIEAPYWLQFIQPFGTVVLGIGAFFIAHRQWSTARDKLRFDLFVKRVEVYAEINNIVKTVSSDSIAADQYKIYLELEELKIRAKFMFGDEVVSALDRVAEKTREYFLLQVDRTSITKESRLATLRIELQKLLHVCTEAMVPYIRIVTKASKRYF